MWLYNQQQYVYLCYCINLNIYTNIYSMDSNEPVKRPEAHPPGESLLSHLFKFKLLANGDIIHTFRSAHSFIIFLLKGSLRLKRGKAELVLREGEMWHVSKVKGLSVEALDTSEIVVCDTSVESSLCREFSSEYFKNVILSSQDITSFRALHICEPLLSMLKQFKKLYVTGMKGSYYQQVKRDEAFLLLLTFYSTEQLTLLFKDFLGHNNSFKYYVLTFANQYNTLDELIQNANMSRSTFLRRFREVFHDSPHHWILQRKLKQILKDITTTQMPFSEISEKYHFSSPAYFATFCKQNFGKTPLKLRED